MKSCVIKSHSKGLTLCLDPEAEFEELITDICQKFADMNDFFGSISLPISIEGREYSNEEISVIIEAIELNSNVKVTFFYDKEIYKDVDVLSMDVMENAEIIDHSVTNKEEIESDLSVIILGDIKKYATVRAKGNIIVLGSLSGNAIAGCEGDENCFIIANKVEAKEATIAGITDDVVIRKRGLHLGKTSAEAIVIKLFQGKLLAEPLSGGLLKQS